MQDIHEKLTPDGMSTDETDDEVGHKVRRVRKYWLAEEISEIYQSIDSHYTRFYRNGDPKPGNRPHIREYSYRRSSQRAAVPCLPVNCYDPLFLASLKEYQRRKLRTSPRVDFPKIVSVHFFHCSYDS